MIRKGGWDIVKLHEVSQRKEILQIGFLNIQFLKMSTVYSGGFLESQTWMLLGNNIKFANSEDLVTGLK